MKIQSQDLRINDYVLYEGRIVRIDSITKVFSPIGYECAVYLEHKGLMRVPINALQPIPLTEELLLKCGFVKREPTRCTMLLLLDEDYNINDSIAPTLQWWIGNDYVSVCRGGIGAKSVKCNSLHQLQNLYWCLCQNELHINL